MARSKGSANLAASLEVLAGAPLDAREVVQAKADLTAEGSFPYKYIGLEVYVVAENKKYRLISNDPTDVESWQEIGSGGGGGGTESYADLTNKPQINSVTLSGNKTSADLGLQGVFQYAEMPTAGAEYEGVIVQFVGLTDVYTHGYFYECVSDGEAEPTYSWVRKDTQPDISALEDLTDVDLTSPTDGQVLTYDAEADKWVNADGASEISELGDIGDVDLNNVTNGQVIKWDATNSKWVNANETGGGGGGGATTKPITAAITVGGISSGTQYPMGTDLEDILSDLLEPTLYPSFTAPSASISYGASTYYAVGATVSAMTATVSLNRGSINPAYGTSGYRSGAATGFAIATTGADTEYSDSSESSGAFSVPALTRATKGTIVVTGTASYAAGEQPKDSKGNDYESALPAGSKTASKTLTFIQPYYYGVSNSSTISDLTGLTENVTAKGNKTFSFTTNNQYMVFVYDSSYGNLKNIVDGNGFDVTGGWTKSSLTVDGFSYYVYVANSPTTDTNAPFTFKY